AGDRIRVAHRAGLAGAPERVDRLVVAPGRDIDLSEVAQELRALGLELEGPLENADGFVGAAVQEQRLTEAAGRGDAERIELERALPCPKVLFLPSGVLEQQAVPHVRGLVVRVDLERAQKVPLALLPAPLVKRRARPERRQPL